MSKREDPVELLNGILFYDSIVRWLGECTLEELIDRRNAILNKMSQYIEWLTEIEQNIKLKKKG